MLIADVVNYQTMCESTSRLNDLKHWLSWPGDVHVDVSTTEPLGAQTCFVLTDVAYKEA